MVPVKGHSCPVSSDDLVVNSLIPATSINESGPNQMKKAKGAKGMTWMWKWVMRGTSRIE